jgi:hypothetical protein
MQERLYRLALDFELLKKQKLDLLFLQDREGITNEESEALTGVINLIDTIQEQAVDEHGIDETEVFTSELDGDGEEKLFEIDYNADPCTLNEFLHVNSGADMPPIDQVLLKRMLVMKVGDMINDIDPNYPAVKRIK